MAMIDKVARALTLVRIQEMRRFDVQERSEDFMQSAVEASYREWLPYAEAALEAMREPTETMVAAGLEKPRGMMDWEKAVAIGYTAMIEAALNE